MRICVHTVYVYNIQILRMKLIHVCSDGRGEPGRFRDGLGGAEHKSRGGSPVGIKNRKKNILDTRVGKHRMDRICSIGARFIAVICVIVDIRR